MTSDIKRYSYQSYLTNGNQRVIGQSYRLFRLIVHMHLLLRKSLFESLKPSDYDWKCHAGHESYTPWRGDLNAFLQMRGMRGFMSVWLSLVFRPRSRFRGLLRVLSRGKNNEIFSLHKLWTRIRIRVVVYVL